ncbi:right-handed parallel beta-helix repeat-containing protein [Paenibacillaceae bacterium]|nr:right-handed parallel beta-helix repeat-containing protein [Paenibacillaceae bacterium]
MRGNQFFVAMDGDDAAQGSIEKPLASFKEAQKRVRNRSAEMKSDITINFRAGHYFLDKSLEFLSDAGDSGKDGYRIVYQAYGYGAEQQEPVILSGGQPLSGWTLHDEDNNIWKISIGDFNPRQLFIDHKRAERAALSGSQGTWLQTETGYRVTDLKIDSKTNGAGMEFVYTGIYPWSEARIGVASVEIDGQETVFTMIQPAYDHAVKLYQTRMPEQSAATDNWDGGNDMDYEMYGLTRPTLIENSIDYLKKPGSFAVDSSRPGDHTLYYIPCEGEDMHQIQAVIPVLETLIEGKGTIDNPLQNVVFQGFTFAHAAWRRPSGADGFLHYHGATFYTGGNVQSVEWAEGASLNVPSNPEITPSALRFERAVNILLQHNQFLHLGTGAVEFTAGCSHNYIGHNRFDDISATAIMVGTNPSGVESLETSNNSIENNHIQNTGCEYHGASAILLMNTQFAVVSHNQINDVPHCGIVVYGGEMAQGIEITYNLVYNTMKMLADGGGIYFAQSQGTSEQDAALVKGNVVYNTITSYNFSLYTDYGAQWITIENNVIHGGDAPVVLQVMPPARDVTYRMNYWDQHPQSYETPPEGITLENNHLIHGATLESAIAAHSEARIIVENAGVKNG